MENSEYLAHYGIKGMKWGIRRYQNKDGTLTKEGQKRYERDITENKAKKKDNRIQIDGPDVNRWVKEDISRSKKTVDATSNLIRETKNMERITRSKPNKQKIDLSSMSDKELRDAINRAYLEKQYNDLYTSEKVSKGREYTQRILEISTGVLAIGSSALSIALSIKELRG